MQFTALYSFTTALSLPARRASSLQLRSLSRVAYIQHVRIILPRECRRRFSINRIFSQSKKTASTSTAKSTASTTAASSLKGKQKVIVPLKHNAARMEIPYLYSCHVSIVCPRVRQERKSRDTVELMGIYTWL